MKLWLFGIFRQQKGWCILSWNFSEVPARVSVKRYERTVAVNSGFRENECPFRLVGVSLARGRDPETGEEVIRARRLQPEGPSSLANREEIWTSPAAGHGENFVGHL